MMAKKFHVLVTRPSPQGEALCTELKAEGFAPLFLPVMEIKPIEDPHFQEQLSQLNRYDWAIFVSRHAVATSAEKIHQCWPQLPAQLKVAAVGEGTAQALEEAELPVTIYPKQWSSEGLLALPELQAVSGKKIAIFCAKGGRELLAKNLQARGAEVTLFIAYERLLPTIDLSFYQALLKKQQLDAIVCTSVQGVLHLKKLFLEKGWGLLQKIPLVLVSERIMIQAKEQGFEACFLAEDPSHDNIVQALQTIRNKRMSLDDTAKTEPTPLSTISSDLESKKKAEKKQGPFRLLLLLGLSVLVIAGAYRGWMLNEELKLAVANFSQQMDANQKQISALEEKGNSLQRQLEQEQTQLQREIAAAEEWRGNGSSRQNYGKILDAEGWARLASANLLLSNDVPAAQRFMERANEELSTINNPEAQALKKAVAEDLAALKNTPWVNASDLYRRLASLQKQIEKLPLLTVPVQASEPVASPSIPTESWKLGLKKTWEALRQIVVVYHLPSTDTPPFVTPDQQPYIYQNLYATLNEAAWALLHQDNAIYHASLQQASEWMQRYFLVSSAETQTVLNEIHALDLLSVQPPKDLVLVSPKAFQDYLKTVQ